MKKTTFIFFFIITMLSCKEEVHKNSIAEDLKQTIERHAVVEVISCPHPPGIICSPTIGWGENFSFPGENFIKIRDDYYNLNHLFQYEITTIEQGADVNVRMILYFTY